MRYIKAILCADKRPAMETEYRVTGGTSDNCSSQNKWKQFLGPTQPPAQLIRTILLSVVNRSKNETRFHLTYEIKEVHFTRCLRFCVGFRHDGTLPIDRIRWSPLGPSPVKSHGQ